MANKKPKKESRIAPIVIGVVMIVCCMIPVSASLFGVTGYVTEITNSERIGGRLDEPGRPNAYWWSVSYKFKTKSGKIETGSEEVKGDAVSAKSGLRVGSPVRYLAFAPGINSPGEGGFDSNTIMYVLCIGFGVFMIWLGAHKPKPPKTPSQRSREHKAAKAKKAAVAVEAAPAPVPESGAVFCANCGAKLGAGAKFCGNCGASQQATAVVEPDWDALEFDDNTPVTDTEAEELYKIATEEEIHEEFDLINSTDEGPAYCRKVLAIVKWRRANGK